MKRMRRVLALVLAMAMCLSMLGLSAAAAEDEVDTDVMAEMGDGEMPSGDGGTSAPSVDYQVLAVLGNYAAIYIEDGEVTTNPDLITTEGTITSTEISGTYIYSATIGVWNKDTDEETGIAGTSGIVIKNTAEGDAAEDAITIGGEEELYYEDGEYYNTVIILEAEDGDEENTAYTDEDWLIDNGDNSNCTFPGVGIAVSASELTIQNTYVETIGYHRPALATYDTVLDSTATLSPVVIVEDSTLISWGSEGEGSSAPTFTAMYGSARPVIINASGDVYFFSSNVISSDWGSYSLDQCSGITVSIVNSLNVNTVGGYGVYAIGSDNVVEMYGTTSISAQYGAIICSAGTLEISNLADAISNDELMSYYDGTLTLSDALNEDGSTQMIGISNAVSFTADMSGAEVVSTLIAEDTYFSTLLEDAVYDGEELVNVLDSLNWALDYDAITNGAPYFFLHYIDGSALCYRSVNSILELTDCEIVSRTGVVIQTVLGYDTSASGIDVTDGDEYYGYVFTLTDMDVEGDVLHEDYQRQMTLTLDGTTLTGAVVTGTMAGWNASMEEYVADLWDEYDSAVSDTLTVGEALEADGITMADTIATLEKNDSYETFWGANLVLTNGSTWYVDGDSSLSTLTIEEGSSVVAADGYTITVYTGVTMTNDLTSYDVTTGTVVSELTAGTYENVVIVVTEEGKFADDDGTGSWSWASDYIYACSEAGIINGIGNNIFSAETSLTRAQAAKIIALAFDLELDDTAYTKFDDDDGTGSWSWASEYIYACVQEGIINGYTDGTYKLDQAVTRAEFAKMIAIAAGYDLSDSESSFTDVADGHWAVTYIEACVNAGIINGIGNDMYDPDSEITRAAAAKIIALAADLLSDSSDEEGMGGMPEGMEGGGNGAADTSATGDPYITITADGYEVDTEVAVEVTEAESGATITASEVSGLKIYSTDNSVGGIMVSGGSVLIGGEEDNFTVTTFFTGETLSFNTVIYLDEAEDYVAGSSSSGGAAITVNGSDATATIENVYAIVNGVGRYTVNLSAGTTIIKNSYFESLGGLEEYSDMPWFTIQHGSSRNLIACGTLTAYIYNSTVASDGYGSWSTDTGGNPYVFYLYNADAINIYGGYGTYADTDLEVYVYASTFDSAEYGAFVTNNGEMTIGSSSDALLAEDEGFLENLEGEELEEETESLIIGARNAIVFHNVDTMTSANEETGVKDSGVTTSWQTYPVLTVSNSTLSTVGATGTCSQIYPVLMQAWIDHLEGSTIVFRSCSGDAYLTNVTLESSSGVLIHSVVDLDESCVQIQDDIDTDDIHGCNIFSVDNDWTGDIVNEDYQRPMYLDFDSTTLTGAIYTYDVDHWNALWADYADVEYAYDEETGLYYNVDDPTETDETFKVTDPTIIYSWLTAYSTYDATRGTYLDMDADSVWTVTDTSNLNGLTVEAGAVINGTVTVDGVEVDISAGGSWTGDIVVYALS